MRSIDDKLTVSAASGPFREPREPVFSYDYSIQRSLWAAPHGVRAKVSIPHELDVLKQRLLGAVTGSPGQQLMISNILSKKIADWKIQVAEGEGMLADRRDTMLAPFVGPFGYLFPKLEALFEQERAAVREDIRKRVGI